MQNATPNTPEDAFFLEDGHGLRLTITSHVNGPAITISGPQGEGYILTNTAHIAAKAAPAIALSILTAAGIHAADPNSSDHDFFGGDEAGAEWAVMWLQKLAESQRIKSAAEVLNERRDALASEIDKDATCYEATCVVARHAIDMIIQLQDEASK